MTSTATFTEWFRAGAIAVLILYNIVNGFLAPESQWHDFRHVGGFVQKGNLVNASCRLVASFLLAIPAVVALCYAEGQTPHGWVLVSQWSITGVVILMLLIGVNIRRMQKAVV
jgi:hypothetical protein